MNPRTNIHPRLILQDSCTPPGICLRRCPPSLLSLQRRYTRLSTRYRFLRGLKVKRTHSLKKIGIGFSRHCNLMDKLIQKKNCLDLE